MDAIKTFKKGNQILRIFKDIDVESPRDEECNFGKMVCFHSRYDLGDKDHGFKEPDDLGEFFENEKGVVYLPLYLMDHSGLSMATNSFQCPWDSGQVGYIYCTEAQIQDEFGGDKERAIACMVAEVATYDQYLTGDVYGFQLVETEECSLGHTHENDTDSCWGFYGDNPIENGMLENLSFDNLDDWKES